MPLQCLPLTSHCCFSLWARAVCLKTCMSYNISLLLSYYAYMPHFSSVTGLYHGKVNVCMAALLTMFIYHSFSVERFVMTLYWPVNLPWVLFRLNSVLSTVQVWQTGVVSLLLFISLSRLVFHLPDSIVLVSLSALWTATPCLVPQSTHTHSVRCG